MDDYTHNLSSWQQPARGIKLLNGINHTKGTWQHERLSAERSGAELARDVRAIIEVNGRKVYISNNILYEHLCQICKQPQECLLIINHRGDKAFEQGILRALKMACNKANIPECTIKALNNTFIRHLIDGGLYYEEIRSIIGQASFYGCDAVKRIGAENKRNLIFCNAWLNP